MLTFDTFLFDLAGDLSFGLITDFKTALAGLLFLGFLYFGSQKLFILLQASAAGAHFDRAKKYLGLMRSDENMYGKDSAEYDYHSRIYQAYMKRSVDLTFASRQPAFEPEVMFTGGDIAGSPDASFDESGFIAKAI